MENRRGDKIIEIEKYIEELITFFPKTLEEYNRSISIRAACERYFDKIIEATIDLAFLIIKEKNLKTPEYDRESFEILAKNNIISEDLSLDLGNAKSMRNWLAHRYGKIDNRKVFYSIKDELIKDVKRFLEEIK
jgi:uncharacterized protein YutE (UPF0331/DUF86 family)